MQDLGEATEVSAAPADGTYRGAFSPQWEIWGPMGGYAASLALRAAGRHCGRARPASIQVHFLGVGAFDDVEVRCTTKRSTRVATSVHVDVVQQHPERGEQIVLSALVWGVDGDLEGLEHQTGFVPSVAQPGDLVSYAELADDGGGHAFWENFDYRPCEWLGQEAWDARSAGEAIEHNWYRFTPTECFADPWLDACRTLIVCDVDGWPAAARGQSGGELEVFAPTIDLSVRFIRPTDQSSWLLGVADAPTATGGLIGHTGRVWSEDGQLVAVGGSTLLCRPAHRRPDR